MRPETATPGQLLNTIASNIKTKNSSILYRKNILLAVNTQIKVPKVKLKSTMPPTIMATEAELSSYS